MSTLAVAQQLIATAADFISKPMKRVGTDRERVKDGDGAWMVGMEARPSIRGRDNHYVNMKASSKVVGGWCSEKMTGNLEYYLNKFGDYGYARSDLIALATIANDAKDAKDAKDANDADDVSDVDGADVFNDTHTLGNELERVDAWSLLECLDESAPTPLPPPPFPPAPVNAIHIYPTIVAQAIGTIIYAYRMHLLGKIDATISAYFETIRFDRSVPLYEMRGHQVPPHPHPSRPLCLICSVLRRRGTNRTWSSV
jgi:hypothetical protein